MTVTSSEDKAIDRQGQWRSARPLARTVDILAGPATGAVLAGGFSLMIVVPVLALPACLVLGCYLFWVASKQYRLPMRVPKSWGMVDYSDNVPGSDSRFRQAEGLLFLGNDDSDRELWITNSDARRHKFVLGTTGSGKTEYLLGNIVQPLCWGSGFLFIDGKGTPEFYSRIWTLAKRFGREDDVRLINFTGVSGEGKVDADALAGSIGSQSNTLNPFSSGTSDQLINMIASLISDSGGGGDMWRDRAVNLMSTLVRALVEMRDREEIFMDVQSIRDYMPLGGGVPGGAKPADGNRKEILISDITETQWDYIRKDKSSGALYLRTLKGEFSSATTLAFKGFFDSLPGFNLQALLEGKDQGNTTLEQYGYLTMQLTKPLGTMADDYAHIFRTSLAEVSMEDVVYRRRILVVLLPALQKAPTETRNLGKIIVSMGKAMMGAASGSKVTGTREEIIESSPTRSSSPFLAVFDEAGYYLVQGMDVMAAQARSLGFSIIVGAQDLQAMRGEQKQVADSVIANTFLTAIGATVDANDSLEFIKRKVGTQKILQSTGMERIEGLAGTSYKEGSLGFNDVERLQVDELRNLGEGQFYFVFRDKVIRGRSFYVGNDFHHEITKNSLVPLRGPLDNRQIQNQPGEESDSAVTGDDSYYIDEMNEVFSVIAAKPLPKHDESACPLTGELMATLKGTSFLSPVDGGPSPTYMTLMEIVLAQAVERDLPDIHDYNELAQLEDSDFEHHDDIELDGELDEDSTPSHFHKVLKGMGLPKRADEPPATSPENDTPQKEPDTIPPTLNIKPFGSPVQPTQSSAVAETSFLETDTENSPEDDTNLIATPDQLVAALATDPATSEKDLHDV